MSEFRKEIGIAVVVASIAALGIAFFAISTFPFSNGTTNSSSNFLPAVLLGQVSTQSVTCSVKTGVCTMMIANNSPVALVLEACQMSLIVSSNGTVSTWALVNGTIGGQAATSLPAGSRTDATCTVPTSDLTYQNAASFGGLQVSGSFKVKLANSAYSYPAGTEAYVGFLGSWS